MGSIREAYVEDGEAIGRVQVEVWRATYAGVMRTERLAAMDPVRIGGLWRERLASPPPGMRTWVAIDGDEVVGFATAGPSCEEEPQPGQRLFAINLLPRVQGVGLGKRLLDAVLEPGPCLLWVVDGNHRAFAFYRRRGFVADGATTYDDRLGVTELRMVRAATDA